MKIGSLFNIFRWRDRRGERVESTEANVFIDDVSHPVMDWSESGFRIENYPDSPAVGERFAFRFELPLTSEDVFEFEAWAGSRRQQQSRPGGALSASGSGNSGPDP